MGNGRRNRRGVKGINPNRIKLFTARMKEEKEGISLGFTCTYVKILERKGNSVLLEAPEVGIKKWISLTPCGLMGDCINGIIYEENENDSLFIMFTELEFYDAKDAIVNFIDIVDRSDFEDDIEDFSDEKDKTIKNLIMDRGEIPS